MYLCALAALLVFKVLKLPQLLRTDVLRREIIIIDRY